MKQQQLTRVRELREAFHCGTQQCPHAFHAQIQISKEKTMTVPQSPVLGTVFALKIQVHEVASVGFPSGHMTSFVHVSQI